MCTYGMMNAYRHPRCGRYINGNYVSGLSLIASSAKYTFTLKTMPYVLLWRSRLQTPALIEAGWPIRIQSAKRSGFGLLALAEAQISSKTL